ncbi:MAG: hypothetical protein IRY85_19135 [Micromonosporaceae bacterium]|nr:hypothetical protein [Micromonosporaceae bacterium]
MDEVTLVGAGLIGAGIASLGLALLVVHRRAAGLGRSRRPPVPQPSRPRPASARPGHPRADEAGPPRLRAAPDPAPRRRPPVPTAKPATAKGPAPTAVGEALEGETLMLGPVPAWRLPVHQRGVPTAADTRPAAPADEPSARGVTLSITPAPGGVTPSTARPRGVLTAALFTRGGHGPRPSEAPAAAPTAAEDGAEPARFGWFRSGR